MLVERIWANNDYRNYHYLIACPESGEALAVDPLDWQKCLDRARERGWTITQILNTHEHRDHTGGNEGLRAATHARVMAHEGAAARIGGVDAGLARGSIVRVGKTVELECLDTPGHTFTHICLLSHTDQPALFSGDTLFNAGAGNCHSGSPELLFETFDRQLARLPPNTRIYPGHDYLARNLEFTLNLEPGNMTAAAWLAEAKQHAAEHARITTLADEQRINTFLRLGEPEVLEQLRQRFPDLGPTPAPRDVFLRLRELRNSW
jgi:hydroxyacylglutathione hydrolase